MADTHQTLRCPACGKEMKKIFIPSQGVNIDICTDGCGGIFFDNREFKMFDEKHEDIEDIIKAVENKEFTSVDESLPRYCPACGAKMVKNYASVRKEVQIDECYSCGGKFLDHGELTKIRSQYETELERSNDFMKCVYNEIGGEIKAVEAASEKAQRNKSLLRKLFDNLILG
ncbi:MAG: zf-TFIIB domain-containing protein [Brachyspira sp.]|uniref:TFIIB-type zinc ribbon-containing protein n=1 Tax=Candidatus Scatousia sp. TaxID=3085663 RepID=UPI0040285DBA|nr:zf-TFIIB domain-containing protein [Brachyspira sp.]